MACNRLSLSPRPVRCFTRPPPDRRPIYEQLVVAVRHPLSIHLSSLSLLFSFPPPFPVLVARGIIIRRCRQNTFRPTGLATTLLDRHNCETLVLLHSHASHGDGHGSGSIARRDKRLWELLGSIFLFRIFFLWGEKDWECFSRNLVMDLIRKK